ncbi:pentraxin-4 [Latimeria chalumnae]|uniref:pentraxin-4 n=1 Tax=Latimeria chalumnae TaxID=7897 RepID=UPI0003C1122F|nr:PREDICTED: pentraxin-4 [Latimeria chalumnae]|eukprot:XP_006001516.1 PREDICTED: pentraxin-4 [Latimeria chalumnae]
MILQKMFIYIFVGLVSLSIQQNPLHEVGAVEQRKPFFERFRRLEEQFRRFQELTLTRLQGIAENYNISYNIDRRFQYLTDQYNNLTSIVNGFHKVTDNEINNLKTWMKKLQKKSKKMDLKVSGLEILFNERNKQSLKETKEQGALLSNLTLEIKDQRKEIDSLASNRNDLQRDLDTIQDEIRSQGVKMASIEEQMKSVLQNDAFSAKSASASQSLNQTPQGKQSESPKLQLERRQQKLNKLRTKHRQLQERQQVLRQSQSEQLHNNFQGRTPQQNRSKGDEPLEEQAQLQPKPEGIIKQLPEQQQVPKQQEAPRKPGTICNVHSVLVFPTSSAENFVTFKKGIDRGIHELSICTWLRTSASYLGTILSYATEENDNKLVLHGRNVTKQKTIHFVIGDPAFRELPVELLLDSRWHHLCIIWSSVHGKYWFYIDRRLVSTGSRFQKGYEIPSGGSLVVGQEQDTFGGGFDSSESFVGNLAGFYIWNHALSPGEVSGIATGKGLPRGMILTLNDISTVNGTIQQISCPCLEHCM